MVEKLNFRKKMYFAVDDSIEILVFESATVKWWWDKFEDCNADGQTSYGIFWSDSDTSEHSWSLIGNEFNATVSSIQIQIQSN